MVDVLVIPREGLVVRDPITKQPLPPGGAAVVLGKYWRRRIRCGDVSVGRFAGPAMVRAKTRKVKEG